jgi:splicing factor 3A subunit 3
MKKRIEELKGNGTQTFELFFSKLKEIREFHENNPNQIKNHQYLEMENPKMPEINFTSEESNGKYLDLHELYGIFINTKFFKSKPNFEKIFQEFSYRSYVSSFFEFTTEKGKDIEYKNYLLKLTEYIISFIKKSKPLFPIEKTLKTIETEREEQWNNGTFVSWVIETEPTNEKKTSQDPSTTNDSSSPLFCTPCNKKFANENVMSFHLKSKKHLATLKKKSKKKNSTDNLQKEIFLLVINIFLFFIFIFF